MDDLVNFILANFQKFNLTNQKLKQPLIEADSDLNFFSKKQMNGNAFAG